MIRIIKFCFLFCLFFVEISCNIKRETENSSNPLNPTENNSIQAIDSLVETMDETERFIVGYWWSEIKSDKYIILFNFSKDANGYNIFTKRYYDTTGNALGLNEIPYSERNDYNYAWSWHVEDAGLVMSKGPFGSFNKFKFINSNRIVANDNYVLIRMSK